MTTWQEYLVKEGQPPAWPYPVKYEQEREVNVDVLVVGGGIAGCYPGFSLTKN